MQTSKFTYKNNSLNLFYGLFSLVLCLLIIYSIKIPNSLTISYKLVLPVLYFVGFCLFIWSSFYHIKTFRKLHGVERNILINEKTIVFPEFADTLNIIELNFSQIKEIYFAKNRHGHPNNLIIKYDLVGHAYIGKDQLDLCDFNEICQLFKLRLGLKKIETKNA